MNNLRKAKESAKVKLLKKKHFNISDVAIESILEKDKVEGTINNIELEPSRKSGIISSSEVTKDLENIFLDLNTVFKYSDAIDNFKNESIRNTQARLYQSINEISKLNSIVDQYENYIRSRGNPSFIYENFTDMSSYEPNMSFYSERYGERVAPFSAETYDKYARELRLPKTLDSNMAVYSENVTAATVSLNYQFGAAMKDLKVESSLKNILSMTDKEVWNETIIADSPIRIEKSTNEFYINAGAMCEVKIDFETVTVINELILAPCSQYPIDIISIEYTTTDSPKEKRESISFSKHKEPLSLIKPTVYRFDSILVKSVFVTINQAHYIREAVQIYKNEELLNNYIYSKKGTEDDETIFKPFYQDLQNNGEVFSLIDDTLGASSVIPISDMFFQDEAPPVTDIKYIYNYGLSYIAASNVQFDKAGFFVSKEIKHIDDIETIEIETIEDHQEVDNEVITDIEYYVTHSDKPSWKDWLPILPKNKDFIHRERLQMYGDTCFLRFPAKKIKSIMIENSELVENLDYQLRENKNGEVEGIVIPSFDHVSMYTCSYEPASGHTINYASRATISNFDWFLSRGESSFHLDNKVYGVDSKSVRVKITNPETNEIIESDANGIICVTDPGNISESYNMFNNKISNYQFYTYKDCIYFNKIIPKGFKVDVMYPSKINKIRLKAILRRNDAKFKYISPVLKEIKYIITTT